MEIYLSLIESCEKLLLEGPLGDSLIPSSVLSVFDNNEGIQLRTLSTLLMDIQIRLIPISEKAGLLAERNLLEISGCFCLNIMEVLYRS